MTLDHVSPDEEKRNAARHALESHDALRAADRREPELDEDGLPHDEAAWITWHEQHHKPAFSTWVRAMAELELVLGWPVGRHPYTFRPICEEILAS